MSPLTMPASFTILRCCALVSLMGRNPDCDVHLEARTRSAGEIDLASSTDVPLHLPKCHEFNRLISSPDEPLSCAASPVRQELRAYLVRSPRLPPRWLRRSPNIRRPQRAINSAATALCSKSRTRARWSTVESARPAGVNSGSRKPADARASAKKLKTARYPRDFRSAE